VDDLGTVSNSLLSISFRTDNSIGVNEIGRRCLLTSHVVFFGTGIISASFHCFCKLSSR
jgi:hypothetical protein